MVDIKKADDEVTEVFSDLAPMVEEIVGKYSKTLDNIISKLVDATALTNEELRQYMLQLSVETYMFSVSKDASVLRQDCATTLMKEAQARSYNSSEGTQQLRANKAVLDTADRQVVNMLYSAVANLMKSRVDEAHRLVATLNSILISRNAEAKLARVDSITNDNYSNTNEEMPFNMEIGEHK